MNPRPPSHRPPPAIEVGEVKHRIQNRFLAFLVLLVILAPTVTSAKLAVFVDGRVLKVEDARLEGTSIVLELPGGGTMKVPAIRIDRVIADEVETSKSANLFAEMNCKFTWSDEPLPQDLPFRESIAESARSANLHPWLVAAVIQTESAFDPLAVSRVGAAGLMQLMPAAAADHNVKDPFNPDENLRGGAEHLRGMVDRFESLPLALAAYNAGATTVERYQGIPPYKETRNYVKRVLAIFCSGN